MKIDYSPPTTVDILSLILVKPTTHVPGRLDAKKHHSMI